MLKPIVYTALTFTVIIIFTVFNPLLPGVGLDISWYLANNQAVAQNVVFGENLLTTLGPYPSIYSNVYHPDIHQMALLGGILIGVCYSVLLLLIAIELDWKWLILYICFLFACRVPFDTYLFSYIFFMSIVVYRMTLPISSNLVLENTAQNKCFYILALVPLGLLLLTKGSVIPYIVLAVGICVIMFWMSRDKAFALITIIVPVASSLAFWVVSGQPLWAFPKFVGNMLEVIFGYSDAMSASGPGGSSHIALYLITSAMILYLTTKKEFGPLVSRLLLFTTFSLFLYVSFKAGFVRAGIGHQMMASTSLVIAALSILLLSKSKLRLIILPFVIITWVFIDGHFYNKPAENLTGLLRWAVGDRNFEEEYENKFSEINRKYYIPKLTGTVDIYSFGQSFLLASGNKYNPRPTVQSFAAYTPYLASLNERYIRGSNAPDNILFRVETIDHRFPSLDDGISWPTLLNRYEIYGYDEYLDLFYLRKKAEAKGDLFDDETVDIQGNFQQEISLPDSEEVLFAEFDIKPTLFGRAMSIIYKRPKIEISIVLESGRSRTYRIIPGMAKSGFIISPLIERTREFIFLNKPYQSYLSPNRVKSIVISSTQGIFKSWDEHFMLRLGKVKIESNRDANLLKVIDYDYSKMALHPAQSIKISVKCQGGVDTINGFRVDKKIINVSKTLLVYGWSTAYSTKSKVASNIYLTLTDMHGETKYLETKKVVRPNLAEYFNNPMLLNAGYFANINISNIEGKYALGISHMLNGSIKHCASPQIQLNINKQPK